MLWVSTFAWGQQISKEEMLFLTPLWKGERFADGRPKASDALLQRLKSVTLEEAWAVLKNENFKHNYEDGWQTINPDSVLVGRALTATFMPGRPDIQRVIDDRGHTKDGRIKSQNSWPIDMLVKGDVYVVDQFGAHEDGPTIGDNLGNSIYAKTGNGIVYNGAVRDINGLKELGRFTSFFRTYHPSHHLNQLPVLHRLSKPNPDTGQIHGKLFRLTETKVSIKLRNGPISISCAVATEPFHSISILITYYNEFQIYEYYSQHI